MTREIHCVHVGCRFSSSCHYILGVSIWCRSRTMLLSLHFQWLYCRFYIFLCQCNLLMIFWLGGQGDYHHVLLVFPFVSSSYDLPLLFACFLVLLELCSAVWSLFSFCLSAFFLVFVSVSRYMLYLFAGLSSFGVFIFFCIPG